MLVQLVLPRVDDRIDAAQVEVDQAGVRVAGRTAAGQRLADHVGEQARAVGAELDAHVRERHVELRRRGR